MELRWGDFPAKISFDLDCFRSKDNGEVVYAWTRGARCCGRVLLWLLAEVVQFRTDTVLIFLILALIIKKSKILRVQPRKTGHKQVKL